MNNHPLGQRLQTAMASMKDAAAAAALEAKTTLAEGRTFSEVRWPVPAGDDVASAPVHVRKTLVLASLGVAISFGGLVGPAGYFITAGGSALFAGIARWARDAGDPELAEAARRMSVLMLAFTAPVVGSAIIATNFLAEVRATRKILTRSV